MKEKKEKPAECASCVELRRELVDAQKGNAELKKQNAGLRRGSLALQEQLAVAKRGIKIELVYGQERKDGHWETNWQATREREAQDRERRREELQKELRELDEAEAAAK